MKSKTTWVIVIAAVVLGFAFTYLLRSPGRPRAAGSAATTPTQAAAEAAAEPAT